MDENQFLEFYHGVSDEYKGFVTTIHEKLLKEGCNVKISSNKTNLFSVKYAQGRKGVFLFMLRKKGLKASVYAGNFAQYPDVLNSLPETMATQIKKSSNCVNVMRPGKCRDRCIGYDINIKEELYQKCKYDCFQFDVDARSIPALLELLESELEERRLLTLF